MSYIIAFVKFPETNSDYPVECFRTDLRGGDAVIVRQADGYLKHAIVSSLRYLNWGCTSRIECKIAEAFIDNTGNVTLPDRSPLHAGLATREALTNSLIQAGWIPLQPANKIHKIILGYSNDSQTANILLRTNGVDLQILPTKCATKPKPFSVYRTSISEGRVVRHHLAHTTFNLYEGIWRFSKSFLRNSGDYDRFFNPVGSRDKRTPELKSRNEMIDIYSAVSDGSGGSAYLGDGIWIGTGGGTHDWGR